MSDQITEIRNALALEAGYIDSLIAKFQQTFPALSESLSSVFGSFNPTDKALALTSNQRDFISTISKEPFASIKPLRAYVPEGLDVSYLRYLAVLKPATDHCVDNLVKTISDYSVFLAMIVTSGIEVRSTKDITGHLKMLEKQRNNHNHELGRCFRPGSTNTIATLGEVVDRNNDWDKVFKESTAVFTAVNSINRTVLNSKIAEIQQFIGIIQNKINAGEFQDATRETIENISELTYAVAKELEYFAAIHYKATALMTSVNDTTKLINDVLRK